MARKSPQEKKAESYAKDRRNTYGENAKASRKAIPRKKRRQARAEGRIGRSAFVAGESLDVERVDAVLAQVRQKRKGVWRLKSPDEPLGQVLAAKRKEGRASSSPKKSILRR